MSGIPTRVKVLQAKGSDSLQSNVFQMVVVQNTGCFVIQPKAIIQGRKEETKRSARWTQLGMTFRHSISFLLSLGNNDGGLQSPVHVVDL